MEPNVHSNRGSKLAAPAAAVDKLIAQDLDGLPYGDKVEWLIQVGWLLDRLGFLWLRDLAAVDARGAAGAEQGRPAASTAAWLCDRLHMDADTADRWVRTARDLPLMPDGHRPLRSALERLTVRKLRTSNASNLTVCEVSCTDGELSGSWSLMAARRSAVALRRALTGVARHQAGYFTAGQALAVGYSYPAQQYHTRQGDWLRIDRGIYRLPDWPVTQHEDLARWTLWSRRRAVVSHETALAVHELGDVMPAQVHLTVPPGFRSRAPGVTLHLGSVGESDVEQFEGFAVTAPLRSILDVAAAGIEADQLALAIGDALDRGLVTARVIRARDGEFGPRVAWVIERALQQTAP